MWGYDSGYFPGRPLLQSPTMRLVGAGNVFKSGSFYSPNCRLTAATRNSRLVWPGQHSVMDHHWLNVAAAVYNSTRPAGLLSLFQILKISIEICPKITICIHCGSIPFLTPPWNHYNIGDTFYENKNTPVTLIWTTAKEFGL